MIQYSYHKVRENTEARLPITSFCHVTNHFSTREAGSADSARLSSRLPRVRVPVVFRFAPSISQTPDRSTSTTRNSIVQFRELAARARNDQHASELFDQSFLWLDVVPPDVVDILREHPVLYRSLSESDSRDGFHWQRLRGGGHVDLEFLVSNLAKSSVKLGGERVATMFHRFLIAGEDARLPAHEIMLLHGLIVDGRVDLAPDAYLDSYEAVKSHFCLPDEPGNLARAKRPTTGELESIHLPVGISALGVMGSGRQPLRLPAWR